MDWLEIRVIVDGEAAEAVAEALRPFAYQGSVVLEQLGDMENLDPRALEPHVTVKMVHPQDEDAPAWQQKIEEILYHLNRIYPIPSPTVAGAGARRESVPTQPTVPRVRPLPWTVGPTGCARILHAGCASPRPGAIRPVGAGFGEEEG